MTELQTGQMYYSVYGDLITIYCRDSIGYYRGMKTFITNEGFNYITNCYVLDKYGRDIHGTLVISPDAKYQKEN